jgi:hypothetical protein
VFIKKISPAVNLLAIEFIARVKDVANSSHPKQSSLILSKNTSRQNYSLFGSAIKALVKDQDLSRSMFIPPAVPAP